jgi:hypothetical protein
VKYHFTVLGADPRRLAELCKDVCCCVLAFAVCRRMQSPNLLRKDIQRTRDIFLWGPLIGLFDRWACFPLWICSVIKQTAFSLLPEA